MTKDELKARYGRIANDPSQLEMFKDDVINGDVLTDVPAPTIEDAGKVLKVNAAGELEYGSGGGGGETDVSVHNLQVEASMTTDGELIISRFQCDSLPENTWFEEPVYHVYFSLVLYDRRVSEEPFHYDNILHSDEHGSLPAFEDMYWFVGFDPDNGLRISWGGVNLVLDDGTMLIDHGQALNLYSGTTSPIPADIGGGSGDDTSAIVHDVIAPTLERHGLVSEPVFGYEDHLFCYGRNDYEIDRLDEDKVIDLITGARYYWDRKAGNALESPLYVSCSNGTYYLNYNGLDYPLQQDIARVDSLDDLTFYYWLGIDKGGALKLVFYYNIPASIPSTLELLSGEVPENYTDFMWYAFSDFPVPIPVTAAIGTRDAVVCADDGIIQVEHSRPTDLVCMFAGSNGIIQLHYWIEGKEMVQLRSEADWSRYHLPGTGGSDTPFDPTKLPKLSFSGNNISTTSADFVWPSPSENWNKKPTLLLIAPDGQEQFAFVKSNFGTDSVLGLLDDDFNTLPVTIDCLQAEISDVINYSFTIHTPSIAAPGELTLGFSAVPKIIDGILGIWVEPTR